MLSTLNDVIAVSRSSSLPALRSTVHRATHAASATAQRVHDAVGHTPAITQVTTAQVTGAELAREVQGLQADFYGRHLFDPFLAFASKADERAYRTREEENRRYIAEQLAKKTQAGYLNASGAMVDQMLDAHAHGAGNSADFASRWDRLIETTRRHRDALSTAGQDTREFDTRIERAVRRHLKTKGMSDRDIDAALSRAANPLEAARLSLASAAEAIAMKSEIDYRLRDDQDRAPPAVAAQKSIHSPTLTEQAATLAQQAAKVTGLDALMAQFKASGVAPASTEPPAKPDPTPAGRPADGPTPSRVPR